jgi:hypothetical protein
MPTPCYTANKSVEIGPETDYSAVVIHRLSTGGTADQQLVWRCSTGFSWQDALWYIYNVLCDAKGANFGWSCGLEHFIALCCQSKRNATRPNFAHVSHDDCYRVGVLWLLELA